MLRRRVGQHCSDRERHMRTHDPRGSAAEAVHFSIGCAAQLKGWKMRVTVPCRMQR